MSGRKLRSAKNCLNCGRKVQERFCSHCGQENIINRPSFLYLFTVFFQDLINYDSNFWRTISRLLFRPGKIIMEYLVGRRKTYVNPIKLYFFVSLISFLFISILSDSTTEEEGSDRISEQKQIVENMDPEVKQYFVLSSLDSVKHHLSEHEKIDSFEYSNLVELVEKSPYFLENLIDTASYRRTFKLLNTAVDFKVDSQYINATNLKELDSIHKSLPRELRIGWAKKALYKKAIEMEEHSYFTQKQFVDSFRQSFGQNFPKVLIFYLPVFAFLLWLFHDKKKWKYYDHGIFTLYFFSFLLLASTIGVFVGWLISKVEHLAPIAVNIFASILFLAGYFYLIYYFFKSHRRVYGDRKWISRLKSLALLIINVFLFFSVLIAFTIYTFWII